MTRTTVGLGGDKRAIALIAPTMIAIAMAAVNHAVAMATIDPTADQSQSRSPHDESQEVIAAIDSGT